MDLHMTVGRYTKLFLFQRCQLYLLIHCLMMGTAGQKIESRCTLYFPEVTGMLRGGDVILGGIFAVHDDVEYQDVNFRVQPPPMICKRFGLHLYQWLQAMVFAVEDVNRNSALLPNTTLGFRIYDSCDKLKRALEGTFWIMTGQDKPIPNFACQETLPLGIIGDAASSSSITIARVLGLNRFPQISYVSSSPLLSDRNQFPSFFRTIPNDDFQSQGLAQLVIYFGWTWVGLLVEDNEYGKVGAHILQQELTRAGICIAFSVDIMRSRADRNAFEIIEVINKSIANVIIVFSSEATFAPLVDEMARHNVTGKIWIASEAWATSALLVVARYNNILNGVLGFAIHSGEMPGFAQHLSNINPSGFPNDSLIRIFWEEAFGCKWSSQNSHMDLANDQSTHCTGTEVLDSLRNNYNNVDSLRSSYNVYRAVHAIALALQDMSACKSGEGPFRHGTCADIRDLKPWQLLHYVKNVGFSNQGKTEMLFNQQGEVTAQYDIVNWQHGTENNLRHVKIGSYQSINLHGKNIIINTTAIHWGAWGTEVPISVCNPGCLPGFRKVGRERESSCCFLCIPCHQGEISNQTDSTKCIKCPWDQWPNERQNQCNPKEVVFLSYSEALGTSLTAVCISSSLVPLAILRLFIHYRNTPIVRANNRSLSYLLLICLTLCFLCSLGFIGYPTPEKCLLRQVTFGISFALCVSCILAKTIMVVIAFNATKPNSDLRRWVGPQLSYMVISVCTLIQVLLCACWLVIAPPFSSYNTFAEPGKITAECNERSLIAFWCMLGYLGLLASISFMVAFLARKLPDNFNEAKFITFSMLAFLSVWLSFIPAYLSTRGKYLVALEIFAIFSSTFTLMCCIFLPKCFIILLRPEMNTKEYMMGR